MFSCVVCPLGSPLRGFAAFVWPGFSAVPMSSILASHSPPLSCGTRARVHLPLLLAPARKLGPSPMARVSECGMGGELCVCLCYRPTPVRWSCVAARTIIARCTAATAQLSGPLPKSQPSRVLCSFAPAPMCMLPSPV